MPPSDWLVSKDLSSVSKWLSMTLSSEAVFHHGSYLEFLQ